MAKSGFSHIPVGPWPTGMVLTLRQDRIPMTGLSEAVNVNIRRDGTVYSRPAWDSVLSGSRGHDLFRHADRTFCVLDGDLVELDPDGATTLMADVERVNWTVLNDEPVFCTRAAVYRIDGPNVAQISGVSIDEFDLDDVMQPLPGGQWVEYWNGRLVVANGAQLVFSEPLRFGAYNPLTGYIQYPSRIEWVAALEGGIYVGLRDKVMFLAGSSLSELSQIEVAGKSAPGMALVVSSELISQEVAAGPRVAVFFTSTGFAVGQANGQVIYPQQETMRDLPLFRGKLVQDGSRIFAVRGL